jgi:hypothetical protein
MPATSNVANIPEKRERIMLIDTLLGVGGKGDRCTVVSRVVSFVVSALSTHFFIFCPVGSVRKGLTSFVTEEKAR